PADWQLARGSGPGRGRSRERVLVRRMRNGRDAVRGGERNRLDARREPPAHAALEIRSSVRRWTDRASPLTDPRILLVEDERNAKTPFELRSEQGRIRRINRDEHRVETLALEERRRGALQATIGAKAEIADAEPSRDRGRPGARANDANAVGDAR